VFSGLRRPWAREDHVATAVGWLVGCGGSEGSSPRPLAGPDGITNMPCRRRNDGMATAFAELVVPSQISRMITIREARPEDASALVDVWLRSVRATHTFLTEEDVQFFLPLVREALSSEQLELWVLSADANSLIGFIGLSGNSLEAMFLDPDHLRAGHGRRLVAHARGLKGALAVDVNEQNPAAVQFYEACGFVVVGRSELDSTGRPFPLLHMRQREA